MTEVKMATQIPDQGARDLLDVQALQVVEAMQVVSKIWGHHQRPITVELLHKLVLRPIQIHDLITEVR